MAYEIVLNLTGTAVKQANALATALGRADIAAASLASNLAKVGATAKLANLKGFNAMTAAQIRAVMAPMSAAQIRASQGIAGTVRGSSVVRAGSNAARVERTRHRTTNPFLLSGGYGLNFGPFSMRASNMLRPNAGGKIMGLSARALNIGGAIAIATGAILKAAVKTIAVSTVASPAIGGGIWAIANNVLHSEGFASGTKLLTRRHLAARVLGSDYEAAQSSADMLAATFGIERSAALSNIAALQGMHVGNSRLSLGAATRLTQTAGLISQSSGVPVERVMTNLQQLMVTKNPDLRDIRELIEQAPILSKYAMRDMEKMGAAPGTDARGWLKDRGAILRTVNAFAEDNLVTQGMRARGMIDVAKQDMWAQIAGNDSFWQLIGVQGKGIFGALGDGLTDLMNTLSKSNEFQLAVATLISQLNSGGNAVGSLTEILLKASNFLANEFGLATYKKRDNIPQNMVSEQAAIRSFVQDPKLNSRLRNSWMAAEGSGFDLSTQTGRDQANRAYEKWRDEQYLVNALTNPDILKTTEGLGNNLWSRQSRLWYSAEDVRGRNEVGVSRADTVRIINGQPVAVKGSREYQGVMQLPAIAADSTRLGWRAPVGSKAAYSAYSANIDPFLSLATSMLGANSKLDPSMYNGSDTSGGNGVGGGGTDFTGMNHDRKALIINFNAPIVEWSSTISASTPQGMVDEVRDQLEPLTSEAIMKAMIGATNTMNSRY